MRIARTNIAAYTTIFTLNEAKAYVRVDNSDEDSTIATLAEAAVRACEMYTGHALINGHWVIYYDSAELEANDWSLTIPVGPECSAGNFAVAYRNTGDTYTALAANTDYYVGLQAPPRLIVHNVPTATHDSGLELLRVTLTDSGYTTDAPADYKAAAMMMLAHLFENRDAVVIGTISSELPMGIKYLLQPYVIQPHV